MTQRNVENSNGSFITSPRKVRVLLAVLTVGVLAVSLLVLKFAPAPFFWLFVVWAAALFGAMFVVRRDWPRAILLNLGIAACIFAGLEAYLIKHEFVPPTLRGNLYVSSDILGWAPPKGVVVHAFKPEPGGLFHRPYGKLFAADYTIGSNGLRVAPPWKRNELSGTVLFFGCSYTFGEGVSDNETLPYQVGALSQGRYRTINFAFEGYSPSQMVAALEHGLVKAAVDTKPTYAYYVAVPIHVWRVAGRTGWGDYPRYILTNHGDVVQDGFYRPKTLDDILGLKSNSRIRGQLDKSAIWRTLSVHDSRVTDEDINLYLALVRRWHDLIAAQFPGIQIRILLWPNQAAAQQLYVYEKIREGFLRMGYQVDLVEELLPGYRTDRSPYILGPSDHHPNALADHILAESVLNEIEQPKASTH